MTSTSTRRRAIGEAAARRCCYRGRMRFGLGWLVGVLALGGCGDTSLDTGDGDYMDEDLPMGQCSGTGSCPLPPGGPPGSVPAGSPCGAAQDCSEGLFCMAPWSEGALGEFTCSAECIPSDDETMWCLDSAGCCDPNATCNARGMCRVGELVDDTGAAGSSGAMASTGTDGTDAGSGQGSGDGSGDASSTDASGSSTG